MKFSLDQTTIEAALRKHLETAYGLSFVNKQAVMTLKAGRGKNGPTAIVEIKDATIPGGEDKPTSVAELINPTPVKVPAADRIATSIEQAPAGTLGAALAQPAPVAEPEAAPAVVTTEPDTSATPANPFGTAVESAEVAAEVPAVTTEDAVAQETAGEVPVATPAATTSGLFN